MNKSELESELKKLASKIKEITPATKIYLFGSYAYGTPNEDSDIDLFLVKDTLTTDTQDAYEVDAKMKLISLMQKYKTNGIDILSASSDFLNKREDYFYKVDILQNGKVLYERTSS